VKESLICIKDSTFQDKNKNQSISTLNIHKNVSFGFESKSTYINYEAFYVETNNADDITYNSYSSLLFFFNRKNE
jgi:hypothetical protein